MLGEKINHLINSQSPFKKDEAEINRLVEERNVERLEEICKARILLKQIKTQVEKIANNEIPIKLNKDGLVYVGNMKDFFSENIYGKLQSRSSKLLIDFIKSLKLPVSKEIHEFEQWMVKNNINNAYVTYQHDGGGIESWNEYWIRTLP